MTTQLRVLDLTDDLALMAGRLLVGTGAAVIRLEPDSRPPAPRAAELHWHAGKRRVRLAPDQVDDVVSRLVAGADVVLESGPVAGLRTLALREAAPDAWAHVAHVVVTPFGLTGPRAAWTADDTVAAAAGGMAWLGGDPGAEPTPPPREQATQLAGAHAAMAALLAVIARRRTGAGQLAEVSVQEAVAATLETGAISWIHGGTVPGRTSGVYAHVAHRVFPTADGYVAGGYSGPNRMWDDLLAWLVETGEAADLTDPVWQDPVHRWQQRAHVDEVVTAFTRHRTTAAIAAEGRARALPWAAVATPAGLLDNPQLAHRGFLTEIETADGPVADVGFPYESSAVRRPVRLPAPVPVGADVTWLDTTLPPVRTRPAEAGAPHPGTPDGAPAGALAGVRVLDLTWVLAGPYVTRTLGDHGADIVKVESRHRQDPTRFAPSMRLRPGAGPDDSGYFVNFNRNKRSLALNLRTDQGPALLRRLAGEADVIVENFSPGTLAKWGLGWEQLRELNPRAVLVSMSGVGSDGPWRTAVTFADTLAAMSGLTHETGRHGRPPQGLTFGLGDMVAANAATLATLEHLWRGEAGHVDLSQLEAMAAHLGTALLDTALPDPDPLPAGATVGPLLLRTAGEDRWLAVGATEPRRFASAVAAVTGERPGDPGAAVTLLTTAAAGGEADAVATELQRQGVAAYPVRDGRDLVTLDPQLAARGFYPTQEHPLAGPVRVEGLVAHLTGTPGRLSSPAPLLGQHTDELLTEILDLDESEIARLHEQGVLE
ncbi:CaiB/BaiF CoA-transferase family protein [Nocardioides nitrophenolicus]|uniref:CaiB/BaiF CoA-transferase family protein n=1 Tax=Nocardioides nitrophenolicus TaxID=60489 RepID=UPI00195C0976|nr:CoA transferase [Nocardioides nitrophenolicus]MBM7517059.1 crotonobetainyl-CoA:carnitine CoA-transferase CaiB-like acyl-CoA transferase [Nocardioides nitrophenolicus]